MRSRVTSSCRAGLGRRPCRRQATGRSSHRPRAYHSRNARSGSSEARASEPWRCRDEATPRRQALPNLPRSPRQDRQPHPSSPLSYRVRGTPLARQDLSSVQGARGLGEQGRGGVPGVRLTRNQGSRDRASACGGLVGQRARERQRLDLRRLPAKPSGTFFREDSPRRAPRTFTRGGSPRPHAIAWSSDANDREPEHDESGGASGLRSSVALLRCDVWEITHRINRRGGSARSCPLRS